MAEDPVNVVLIGTLQLRAFGSVVADDNDPAGRPASTSTPHMTVDVVAMPSPASALATAPGPDRYGQAVLAASPHVRLRRGLV